MEFPPYITIEKLDKFILEALNEDVQTGDHTSLACISKESRSKAKLLVKDCGVLAGVHFAKRTFELLDPTSHFELFIEDGSAISFGDVAFIVECNTQILLKAERLILNTMQRMSGIASLSNRFLFEVEGLPVKLIDTRKTTPLFRMMEKWAVKLGGCENYRIGLYDWIMIKDNHVDACGSHTKAIEAVHEYLKKNNLNLDITVEVRNLVELYEVLQKGGIRRIMLDNFELPLMKEAVEIINNKYEVEASGGVNIFTVRKIALTGVNYISIGAVTHHAQSLDLSLKVIK
ncbi:MAG: carboxylating nicotinate-nucleotide diphosphorylase [Saprospiraceae bacterium]|nr:carboxylating nicotinate-nucleotide diphosphorylase [Saprospiraceae bacterium]